MLTTKSEAQRDTSLTMYSLFAWLWAMGVIWHYLRPDNPYHVGWPDLFVVVGAILVLIRPQNPYFLLATAIAFVLAYLLGLVPSTASNHWTLQFFVSLTLCASFAIIAVKRKRPEIDSREWLVLFRPVICLLVVMLYLFASLHKMNGRYLSEFGAAPQMYRAIVHSERMAAFEPLFPTDDAFLAILPQLSILIELAIPILLLFRRSRLVALLIGVLFHTALSLREYPPAQDFIVFVAAAYILFLPDASIDVINATLLDRLRNSKFYEAFKSVIVPAVLLAVIFVPALYSLPELPSVEWFSFANLISAHWSAFAATYISLLALLIYKLRIAGYGAREGGTFAMRRAQFPLISIIILAFFVGMSPYLGLKTAGAFTMFSQLETEGNSTNHLFMPLELQIFDYQKQVCVIETTAEEIPVTALTGELLTYHRFRKLTRRNPEASITYTFEDERFELKRIDDKPELVADLDLFERFYLAFQHSDWDKKTTYCDGRW